MYKPILVKSNSTGDIGRYIDSNNLILRSKNDLPRGEDADIIIVDTKTEIVKYDWVYDKTSEELVYQVDTEPIPKEYPWFKIVISTNRAHTVDLGHLCLDTLPQLSNTSKQLLFDYYNEHGEMPESVDIEETYKDFDEETHTIEIIFSLINQQGEVDITIPEVVDNPFIKFRNSNILPPYEKEKTYTEEDLNKAFIAGYLQPSPSDKHENYSIQSYFKEWFNSKKK